MSFVHLSLANQIDSPEMGLPGALNLRDGSGTRMYWSGITERELNECGWFTVATVARPADTPTQTSDRSVVVVNNLPTEKWTVRSKTQAELDGDRDIANEATIRSQATTAISNNQTYLAIASPTNAQVVAQVRALTQQMNGVIRLVLRKLDATN